ncbi:helix-turn-helix domain-containing protein [Laribacter hongkongensis]|uniref:helix-turn-helix domain-containing protein n=1 Tax=Laribacter hongkongensis TaxID=168471 RepID=UPI000480BE9B|nr:helix-turn-helix domain-containing protein [Laribacter hongkongensis]MCG9093762.1 helix-turn-helix domain-containing protein [Laribacter hongkongensis]
MKCARPVETGTGAGVRQHSTSEAPAVTGQCAQVLNILRQHPEGVLSLELTANAAIPEAAARIHNLRHKGFNVITRIEPEIRFRGATRRNVARYSLGVPAWPAPGFFSDTEGRQ